MTQYSDALGMAIALVALPLGIWIALRPLPNVTVPEAHGKWLHDTVRLCRIYLLLIALVFACGVAHRVLTHGC